jgi:hypothetical protein
VTRILNSLLLISVLFTSLVFVGLRPVPEDEAILSTIDYVELIFQADKREINAGTEDLSFFLPSGMEIHSELQFNTILEKDEQVFILFHNPQEHNYSETLYKAAKKNKRSYLLVHSFKKGDQFGYIHVLPIAQDHYEVVVSFGDIKLTTQTTTNDMKNSVKVMAEIVHSVMVN